MTDISFYVGKQPGLDVRLRIACILAKKARQHDLQVHIHTDSRATSQKLDTLLWVHDEQSFLSHSIINASASSASSASNEAQGAHELETITLSHEYEPITRCDYLINLSDQLPNFFSRFKKMAEIIDQNEESLTAGRKRYAFYRDRGYTLEYHQL